MDINYIKGDATNPVKKPAFIVHICNDIGAWGAGFVMCLSKKWPETRRRYCEWYRDRCSTFGLGYIQYIPVDRDIIVINMIGQHGIYRSEGRIPLRYDALRECLRKVYIRASHDGYTVHMPRIGCGLAGGTWFKVESIIRDVMEVRTYVYDLLSPRKNF